jgi:predicted HicB family RNase H-like nuclease
MDPKKEEGRLNVRLPKDFLKRLKVECVRREITLQTAAEEALEAWLRKGAR